MSSSTGLPIEIRTFPDQAPSLPPWFAEVVILARHFTQQGHLDAISQQVRLARGRAGSFDVIAFVALLLGYAASGEPTIQAFVDRLAPFAQPFMALFGRNHLPHRATLSRFLAAVDPACRDGLRQVFLTDLMQHGCAGQLVGGFLDRQGQRLLVFDIDGTRQAARQRALATSSDLPVAQRRRDAVCAPGYTGRKRGEVVRTRTTSLQAHTQEWLGSFSNRGNGDYVLELEAACQVVSTDLVAKGLEPAQALLRLDGLYGTVGLLARIHPFKLGFLTGGREYHLLDHPSVQARHNQPSDGTLTHDASQIQRELFDVGFIADWLPERPELVLSYRLLVTRRRAPADSAHITVGKLRDGQLYELFLTSQPASSLPAATMLELYQQPGSFEQVLSDEDAEQDPDRWWSRTRGGQEFWQIISQWLWNIRLCLGLVAQPQEMRWTIWASALSPVELDRPVLTDAAPEAVKEDQLVTMSLAPSAAESSLVASEGTLVPIYGPLVLSQAWAKARRRFSAQAFSLGEGDTLRCPAGRVLRPRERRKMPNGDLRVLYAPGANDCRGCALAPACLGRGASGQQPRRVSGVRRVVGWQVQPQAAGEPPGVVPSPAEPQQQNAQHERVPQWGDVGGRRMRRMLVTQLRCQQVSITRHEAGAAAPQAASEPRLWTRAERAHRRQSWASRLAGNACGTAAPRYIVTLAGIAPALATYLGLPSVSAP